MEDILKNQTVLFADDERVIRENFSNFLSSYFKDVYLASNGEEALNMYYEKSPNAIILDINMPILDGLQVAQKIRNEDIFTPIIMLTAHTDKERLLKAVELNLLKYVVKPINRRQSREILELFANKLKKDEEESFIHLECGISWNIKKRNLYNDKGIEIKLRTKEREFMEIMIINRDKEVSFLDIFNHIWKNELPEYNMSNRIKTIAKDLRKKLPENSLTSIYGFGFKL